MNILFDHQAFSMQKYGGISRYYAELLNQNKIDRQNKINLASIFSNNEYLSNDPDNKKIDTSSFYSFKGKKTIENWLNKQYSLYELRKKSYDIFHPTYYDTYFLKYIKNKPFTITFYDLIHEKYGDRYDELSHDRAAINNKLQLLDKARKVIAISESTKNDIVSFYNIDPIKIKVIYLASSLSTTFADKNLVDGPYFLFVGSRVLYKNFKFLIKAIGAGLLKEKIKLVCAGGGAFSENEMEYITNLGLQNLVIYKHNYTQMR
jgi:glycosyltransferase involved in cell wall biosynthesis